MRTKSRTPGPRRGAGWLALLLLGMLGPSARAAFAPPAQEEWVFLHPTSPAPGGLRWPELGRAYLGRGPWRDVGADPEAIPARDSRFVVGVADAPPAAALLTELGVSRLDDGGLHYRDRDFPADTGLVITAPDPDGGGRIAFFTGGSSTALYQCFTVPVDLLRDAWLAVADRKVIARGRPRLSGLVIDARRPRVVRLDRELLRLRAETATWARDEAALRVARALTAYREVYAAALGPDPDLFRFHRPLLDPDHPLLAEIQNRFGDAPLEARIEELYARTEALLGPSSNGPAPVFYLLVGDPRGTNARSFDADPLTGRPRVLLNLAAHASLDALKISIVHESIHTFQTPGDGSFATRALREGEAVALTRVLLPATSAAAAMMWPEAKYATARRMREALLAAFRGTLRDCAENPTHGKDAVDEWLTLGHAPAQPPGAPDRSGYWIATLAAESWLAAHTDLGPRALLRCSPAEVFTTLR